MFDVYHVVLWIFVGVLDNIDLKKIRVSKLMTDTMIFRY